MTLSLLLLRRLMIVSHLLKNYVKVVIFCCFIDVVTHSKWFYGMLVRRSRNSINVFTHKRLFYEILIKINDSANVSTRLVVQYYLILLNGSSLYDLHLEIVMPILDVQLDYPFIFSLNTLAF